MIGETDICQGKNERFIDGQEVRRNIKTGSSVSHDRITNINQLRINTFQVRHNRCKLSKKTLRTNVSVDDVRVFVDVVGIETINQLLKLSVIKDLPTNTSSVSFGKF